MMCLKREPLEALDCLIFLNAAKQEQHKTPHGQDHSIFVSFAPKDNPKIAIAVIIENGYWGSRWAAPIASLMTEKYLTDTITRPAIEQRMVDGALHEEYRLQHLSIYGEDSTYQANF